MTIPRTEGISTTDIVGRMLLMTRFHHESTNTGDNTSKLVRVLNEDPKLSDELRKSRFLTTSRTIRLFGAGVKVSCWYLVCLLAID